MVDRERGALGFITADLVDSPEGHGDIGAEFERNGLADLEAVVDAITAVLDEGGTVVRLDAERVAELRARHRPPDAS